MEEGDLEEPEVEEGDLEEPEVKQPDVDWPEEDELLHTNVCSYCVGKNTTLVKCCHL